MAGRRDRTPQRPEQDVSTAARSRRAPNGVTASGGSNAEEHMVVLGAFYRDLRRRLFARLASARWVPLRTRGREARLRAPDPTLAPEGQLGELNARFRNNTTPHLHQARDEAVLYMPAAGRARFAEHAIYVLEHPSREAAKKAWADFAADPGVEAGVRGVIASQRAPYPARWCRCSAIPRIISPDGSRRRP